MEVSLSFSLSFLPSSIFDSEHYFYQKRHVPAFGSWDWDESLQFTQCFESATHQAGLLRNGYSESDQERDLYVAGDLYENDVVFPAMIVVPRRRASFSSSFACGCVSE
ncbi:uncharacterized protein G2W53_002070 [Senna tora]|uniref:Uncharacterized protein n=1 Tax=Senna tora TaxID=362788 RepID=A0A834XIN5_9FABA|nr:uncharacterized protein G2W53_002070 [Senna tora]